MQSQSVETYRTISHTNDLSFASFLLQTRRPVRSKHTLLDVVCWGSNMYVPNTNMHASAFCSAPLGCGQSAHL